MARRLGAIMSASGISFFFKSIVAVTALAGAALAQETAPRTLDDAMAELAGGGAVVLMRHANSPSGQLAAVGMSEGCILGEGRGLDAKGFFQARFIGEFLRSEGVGLAAAYTSDMCRTWDTARLVAAGAPVEPEPALKTTNISEIDAFKQKIAARLAANPRDNILLVSHSNIVPLYADWGSPEEIPSGVVLIVDPATWTVRDKLNLDVDLSVD
jgi:broad specificity phosphatase PhoE